MNKEYIDHGVLSPYHLVEKKWGHEIWFVNNEKYCGKILFCRDKIWSSEGKFHYHKIKDETFFILESGLLLDVIKEKDGKEILERLILFEEMSFRIKPNILHRFKSVGKDCKFLEVSTTHREDDSYRIERNIEEEKIEIGEMVLN